MAAPPEAPGEAAEFSPARLIDTHAHLMDRRYAGDLPAVLERARQAGIIAFVVVGFDVPSSKAAIDLAERHPDVWAAVGVHPHNARQVDSKMLRELEDLASAHRVVAIGECGLDFYRNLSPAAAQEVAFVGQLDLARRRGLPVIIHSRDAMVQTLAVLRAAGSTTHGVMHCFDGTEADALAAVSLGLSLSCAGPLTYRKDQTLARALSSAPLESLLVETDCPYLSPDGYRGQRNEPAHVRLVTEALARVRGVGFQEMANATSRNAIRLFSLPVPLSSLEQVAA